MSTGRNVMQKLVVAVAVTATLGLLPVSSATAAGTPSRQHHRVRNHVPVHPPYADPAVRGGYIMNGNFDWRRRGEHVPWYGHGYSDDCVAWSQNAYHYACDPNNRY
jgi:hypothetical protein